jgi:quercetin dioxygenase-like cupin family protein
MRNAAGRRGGIKIYEIFIPFEFRMHLRRGFIMSNRSRASSFFAPAACLLLGLALCPHPAAAETNALAPPAAAVSPEVRMVLSTGMTVTGEPIHYPSGGPAHLIAEVITLQPGQQTGWHTHPVPLFGYILQGELTVNYGAKGKRIYRKGDGLAEAINEAHNGRNTGPNPMKILAVYMGQEGLPDSASAPPPAH